MRIFKATVYVLALVFCVTCAFSASDADVQYCQKPLPYQGMTPLEDAVSLFYIDSEITDTSTEIYSNIVKFDPLFYMLSDVGLTKINPWDEMTPAELETVKGWAADITKDCTTADEKIYAVMEYVSDNVYYDMDFYNSYEGDQEQYRQMLNHNAYDVLTNKTAVCYGYAATVSALLQISGVPCITIESPNHAWNMAYNGKRWILFDTTWISPNRYLNGEFLILGYPVMKWYDFTIDDANADYNHIITGADYCEYGNTIYNIPAYTTFGKFDIPQNIVTISDFAFYEAGNISITGDMRNVEYVGEAAFYNCYLYDGVINLQNAVYIGEFAFYGCTSIDGVISFGKLLSIEKAAFYNCISLDGVTDFDKVTVIKDYAFYKCENIDGAKGLDHVTSIGNGAFCGCKQLTGDIDFAKAENIGEFAFDMTNLSKAYIPNDDITIGRAAFQRCPLTIYAHKKSAAREYAEANRIPFSDIDALCFTVSYNADGATGVPEPSVKRYGGSVRISETIPQKKGSEFTAWSSSSDGKAEYYPGDNYSENHNLVLYAVWNKIIIYGDAQGDGTVDVSDVIFILQCLAASSADMLNEGTDVNGDGIFDVSDVIRILQYLASPGTQLGPQ